MDSSNHNPKIDNLYDVAHIIYLVNFVEWMENLVSAYPYPEQGDSRVSEVELGSWFSKLTSTLDYTRKILKEEALEYDMEGNN